VTSGLLLLPFSPERSPYRELSAQEEHSHPEDPFLSSSEVRDVSVQDHENCDMSVKANEVVASEACFKYANLQGAVRRVLEAEPQIPAVSPPLDQPYRLSEFDRIGHPQSDS